MKAILVLSVQKTIVAKGKMSDEDEWPEDYEKKRDELIRKLEEDGWDVTIEYEEDTSGD